jgi:hypothetical protein
VPQNWLSWILRSPREAERAEMRAFLERLRDAQRASPLSSDEKISAFVFDMVVDVCERRGVTPAAPLGVALYTATKELLHHDAMIGELPDLAEVEGASLEEGVRLRAAFRRNERFLAAHTRLLPLWREKIVSVFAGCLEYFPDSAFVDVREDGTTDDDSIVLPETPAYALCERLPELVSRTMRSFFDDDVADAQLFEAVRETFDENLYRASGIALEDRGKRNVRVVLPHESKLTDPSALVDAYLDGTALHRFFYRPLPFAIPFPARFEHTHVVGGTGHGKTQLLQFLIHHDLVRAREDGRSIVVIDSQGDLIRTISRLGCWDDPDFRERFVLVDPNDVEHPVCLNMFDFNRDRLSGYAPVDREKILNATIELYDYFFGALLGAELTQRQGLIFRYLARLIMEIPGATVHTLRELMEDGDRFRPFMERLTGSARSFFATQFFDRKFGETKKQILTRLWGVLSNSSLERMFSHTKNRIDLFELMNAGKVVLVNTAKDLLGQEGSAIFGRFFVALIAQAAVQRAPMAPHERRPAFVYIDEAHEYFDHSIEQLLAQARKYRVGLVFAHQHMDQLSTSLRASVLASTTIKFAGGVSAKDAVLLDSEYRCTANFLLERRKRKQRTEFACYVKNYTASALSISIPLGFVEAQPQIDTATYDGLIEQNRALYSEPRPILEEASFPPALVPRETRSRSDQKPSAAHEEAALPPAAAPPARSSTVPTPKPKPNPKRPPAPAELPQPGRGGRQHKYVQQLIKQLAEERGFRATIEESILDGAGRVDVSLIRADTKVACQVSVTTTKDWELGGVEKCLAAGYREVLLVGTSDRHKKTLAKFVEENLDTQHQGRVRYLTVESLVDYFTGISAPEATSDVVRGYKVRTTQQPVGTEEAALRRKAITGVIARSIQKVKKDERES